MSTVKKILFVLLILAVGGGVAMMFRKPRSEQPEAAAVQPNVTLREDAEDPLDLDTLDDEPARQGVPLPDEEQLASAVAENPVDYDPLPVVREPARAEPVVPRLEPLERPEMARTQPPRRQAPPSIPSAFDRAIRPPLPELGKVGQERFSNVSVTPPAPPRLTSPPRVAAPLPEPTVPEPTAPEPAVPDVPVAAEPVEFLFHTIVNGDNLSRLAQRYLGSADRYNEIYDLNRAVLPSPDVLPLGRKLKIPPRKASPAPAEAPVLPAASRISAPPPSPRLVPLPPDAFFRRQ